MSEHADAAPHFRFKIVPILVTIFLGFGLPVLGAELLDVLRHASHLVPAQFGPVLPWLYALHLMQMLLALVVIAAMKWLVPADYGLHMPRDKSYVRPAILWGLLFGVVMTLVDYGPQLLAHAAPKLDYRLSAGNVIGWLGFKGVVVGPTEEIPFRALLVTYLAATMPGRLRLYRYEMNGAGIVVAAIFALNHLSGFWTEQFPIALGQLVHAFALGVLYAYWLEKSKSVLAPIVGHNVGDLTEYVLLFLMVAFWR